jgi:tRNA(Ser,Leu) C12 N-acetylase TAN1
VTHEPVTPSDADWNIIVTLPEQTFREARNLLRRWGKVRRTHYYNVLSATVPDPMEFLRDFGASVEASPGLLNFVSHVMPAQRTFNFDSAAEFENRARDIALSWLPLLVAASFHVRLHRRGFKGTLSTPDEERFLDAALLSALAAAGTPGQIEFDDPDRIIQIETVDGRAGMSIWAREELRRFPFLGCD